MSNLGSEQLTLVLTITVGAMAAVAAIGAFASAAIARLSNGSSPISTPALAAFVLSIAALVVIQLHHHRFLPFVLGKAA